MFAAPVKTSEVKRYPWNDVQGAFMDIRMDDVCTCDEVVDAANYDALLSDWNDLFRQFEEVCKERAAMEARALAAEKDAEHLREVLRNVRNGTHFGSTDKYISTALAHPSGAKEGEGK